MASTTLAPHEADDDELYGINRALELLQAETKELARGVDAPISSDVQLSLTDHQQKSLVLMHLLQKKDDYLTLVLRREATHVSVLRDKMYQYRKMLTEVKADALETKVECEKELQQQEAKHENALRDQQMKLKWQLNRARRESVRVPYSMKNLHDHTLSFEAAEKIEYLQQELKRKDAQISALEGRTADAQGFYNLPNWSKIRATLPGAELLRIKAVVNQLQNEMIELRDYTGQASSLVLQHLTTFSSPMTTIISTQGRLLEQALALKSQVVSFHEAMRTALQDITHEQIEPVTPMDPDTVNFPEAGRQLKELIQPLQTCLTLLAENKESSSALPEITHFLKQPEKQAAKRIAAKKKFQSAVKTASMLAAFNQAKTKAPAKPAKSKLEISTGNSLAPGGPASRSPSPSPRNLRALSPQPPRGTSPAPPRALSASPAPPERRRGSLLGPLENLQHKGGK